MKLAEWILSLGVRSADEREMILGDLLEQAPRRGAAWCARQALAIAIYAAALRVPAFRGRASGGFVMQTWVHDIRYAARALRKRPLVTLTVAVTLAFGLGANAAVFSMVDRLILRPYPLVDADRAVMLAETGPQIQYRRHTVSPGNFVDWRATADTMQHLAAVQWWDANLVERDDPERLAGFKVSAAFFDALGVRPALGRGFVRDDETFGRHHVLVISDVLWNRRFDRDPAILGRRIVVDGEPHQIIGVAPPRFRFPDGAEIWAPIAFDPKSPPPRAPRYLTVIGRLRDGRTLEDAQAQMTVIADRLARDFPDTNRDHGARVYTLTNGMLDEGSGPILSLWQASAFVVLLIACANIANLLLARAAERRRETALRLALGAGRGRVVRELLTESLLLGLIAVPLALAVAWVSLRWIRVTMPANILRFVPGIESLGLDTRLLTFTLGLTVLAACVFGILPALQASRSGVADALKEGGRTMTGRQWLRRGIVVAELAIALPLLVAAGLGALGAHRFLNGPQGYDPDGLLTMKIVLPQRVYADEAAQRRFMERALDAVAAVPGVERAAIANDPPASGGGSSATVEIDGHPAPDPRNPPAVDSHTATAGYFAVMRIPIARGRAFSTADRESSTPVAIVSESMAAAYWPGEDPIGRRVKIGQREWSTVVGVSGDVIHDWFNSRNAPTVYQPIVQRPSEYFSILARTSGDPASVAGVVRQALLRVDATQPVFDMMPMRKALSDRTIGLQYLAAVMTAFGGLALVLAAVGLYAVISYLVAQRRHEIGVRIALGATAADVVRLTVGQALTLTLAGTAIGLVLSVALSRLMEAGMLGISSSSTGIFAVFAAVLVTAALVAGYLPARRAAAIDPMVALRTD